MWPWRRREEEKLDADLHLVVGLGNPGPEYERTRHNIGFMVVERLADRHGLAFRGSKHRADIARGVVEGVPVLLAMPVTYMNDSGFAVSRLLRYYRVSLDRLLVVADEMDLPFGTLRVRPSGSSAGNGGMKSIIRELGTEDFPRLRVGVGRPAGAAVRHVLGSFPPEQSELLPALVDTAADAVTAFLRSGARDTMNRFNRDWLPELRVTG